MPDVLAQWARLLVDTTVLWDLFLHHERPAEARACLPGTQDVDRVQSFLTTRTERCTTPHVLTEIDGRIKRLAASPSSRSRGAKQADNEAHRQAAFGQLFRGWLDERTLDLDDTPAEHIGRFGLCDAVLLGVAKRDGLTLLSGDAALVQFGLATSVPAVHISEVLSVAAWGRRMR